MVLDIIAAIASIIAALFIAAGLITFNSIALGCGLAAGACLVLAIGLFLKASGL